MDVKIRLIKKLNKKRFITSSIFYNSMGVEHESAKRILTNEKCPKCGSRLYKSRFYKATIIECSKSTCGYEKTLKF